MQGQEHRQYLIVWVVSSDCIYTPSIFKIAPKIFDSFIGAYFAHKCFLSLFYFSQVEDLTNIKQLGRWLKLEKAAK